MLEKLEVSFSPNMSALNVWNISIKEDSIIDWCTTLFVLVVVLLSLIIIVSFIAEVEVISVEVLVGSIDDDVLASYESLEFVIGKADELKVFRSIVCSSVVLVSSDLLSGLKVGVTIVVLLVYLSDFVICN